MSFLYVKSSAPDQAKLVDRQDILSNHNKAPVARFEII